MTGAEIIALRDKAFGERRRRFANYVVQVLRLTLEWGKPRGWLRGNPEGNPAMAVALIRRAKGQPKLNRAWKEAEIRAFLTHASGSVKLPFALGLFAGMREGDVVCASWRWFDGEVLEWRSAKNDEENRVPATGVLRSLLDGASRSFDQICLNAHGRPWASEDSLRSAFFKTVRSLQRKELIGRGATFHGLRHTVAAGGRDAGASEFHVAAALGDRSTAMAALYGKEADRRKGQMAVMHDLQSRFADASLETKMETDGAFARGGQVIPLKKVGGLARNRTGVHGFAVRCVTSPPPGLEPLGRASQR